MALIKQSSRYSSLVRSLAEQGLALAKDESPHKPRPGVRQWSMMLAVPLAKALAAGQMPDDANAAPLADALREAGEDDPGRRGMPRFTDGIGHCRDHYYCLALHISRLPTGGRPEPAMLSPVHAALDALPLAAPGEPRSLALWLMLCRAALADGQLWEGDAERIDAMLADPGKDGALHTLGFDDLIDAWTFRELAGLHALTRLASVSGNRAWQDRVQEIATFHQGHTQPDYTTYQPWGLPAFLAGAATQMFAEQQLHDAATHLSLEGSRGALLPAVLLAETAWSLCDEAERDE